MKKIIYSILIFNLLFLLCGCKEEFVSDIPTQENTVTNTIEEVNNLLEEENSNEEKQEGIVDKSNNNVNVIDEKQEDNIKEENNKEENNKEENKKDSQILEIDENAENDNKQNNKEEKNDTIKHLEIDLKNNDELLAALNGENNNQETNIISSDRWYKPLEKGKITQEYSKSSKGIDIGGNSEGTSIYAPANGYVIYILRNASCGGNIVYLNVLVNNEKYTVQYASLLDINVNLYDMVNPNTIIGTVGGHSTSSIYVGADSCAKGGAYLHYGLIKGWLLNQGIFNYSEAFIKPIDIPTKKGEEWNER